jgi:hypothetical protein
MIIFLAEMFRKKVMIYANGIGPVRKKAESGARPAHCGSRRRHHPARRRLCQELLSMGVKRNDIRAQRTPCSRSAACPPNRPPGFWEKRHPIRPPLRLRFGAQLEHLRRA